MSLPQTDSNSNFLEPIERVLLTSILRRKLKNKRLLVAVSGGRDSMALIMGLSRVAKKAKVELGVAHVHHGQTSNSELARFRGEAQALVASWCEAHGVRFFNVIHQSQRVSELSETRARDVRYHYLRGLMTRNHYDVLVLAHHRDDLLETRMMRLLRGVGPQGLNSMKVSARDLFRPLLRVWRSEITGYVERHKISYVEDPTNDKPHNIRNWIRGVWLKSLSDYNSKYVVSLERSLSLLSKRATEKDFNQSLFIADGYISRSEFSLASRSQRASVVVHYMKHLGVRNYTQSKIREILKRLDTSRNELTFRASNLDWTLTPTRIWARLVDR